MKGITPVITTVLLLLMAVAAVGGAWVWYQRMQTSAMAGGSGQVDQLRKTAVSISVDKLVCTDSWYVLTLANTGTTTSTITNVTLSLLSSGAVVGYFPAFEVSANTLVSKNLTGATNNCATGTMYVVDARIGASYILRDQPITAQAN